MQSYPLIYQFYLSLNESNARIPRSKSDEKSFLFPPFLGITSKIILSPIHGHFFGARRLKNGVERDSNLLQNTSKIDYISSFDAVFLALE